MIKILVTDDDQNKLKHIRSLLDSIPEIEGFDTATNIIAAKKLMSSQHYDLLILDLCLPLRDGDDPNPENGINFLDDINRVNRIIKPYHIVGLSEFGGYIDQFKVKFENQLWALIKYESGSTLWETLIKGKLNYLIDSKRSLFNPKALFYQFDLAIVTALRQTELEAVLALPASWQAFKLPNDATEYFKGCFSQHNKKITVIAAAAPQMGMVAASVLTDKLITNFRPKHVVMTGIAGGVKGVGNFGDILVAEISYDSGSGKIKADEDGNAIFEPDYRSIDLNVDLKEAILSCKTDRSFLDDIKKRWMGNKPSPELNVHIGPFASGAGVIQNKKIIEQIKGHSRKLIGIDMETYGVFYTCKNCSKPRPYTVASYKSLSDFGDHDKNDDYQKYAAYTSATFLYHFALEKMEFDLEHA
jgi:nucleoside phosphorylase/CheY-like chemotaxis protein